MMEQEHLSRRSALVRCGTVAGIAWSLGRPLAVLDTDEPDSLDMIVRNERPLNLETPVEQLTDWITPIELFFVRSHFGPPAVGLHPWSIRVLGDVNRPATVSVQDLGRHEQDHAFAVLQCAGNGRAFFEPRIPGVGWERGAVGNARWTGARLRDVLDVAGIDRGAAHVHFHGGDVSPHPKTPPFVRSLPIERALDPSTLLATHMNGQPLPVLHGGPVRVVVPGWAGNHWVKWVRAIVVAREEATGFYQRTGYRMPKVSVPPGTDVKADDLVPVTTLNVKSLITRPKRVAGRIAEASEIRGLAWTGVGRVDRVEVSIDRLDWRPAAFVGPTAPHAWRLWRIDWAPGPGKHTIRARAFDSNGQSQPASTPWNKSGYLWNGIDQVDVEVVA